MKKRISLLIVLVLVLGLALSVLASCGDDNSANKEYSDGAYDGSEVTITFYHTMGQNIRPTLVKYIEKFNELYPNIHIVEDAIGGYDDVRDQIKTELTTGAGPNIAYCYPDHVALYNKANAVVQLDGLIANTNTVTDASGNTSPVGLTSEQIADFIPGYYEEGRQFGDGKMYTMPFSKSTEVLYYNVDFFEENGLTPPTTWDEMEAVCKRIKEIDPTCIPLGYDSEANWFITMCEQLGSDYTSATGNHFLFDNETNRNFVKKFNDWYQKGYLTTQSLNGKYTSTLFVNTDPANPRSYMSIGSSAGATHQRPERVDGAFPFEVGIVPIPQENASNPKVISQGPSVCIFKKSNEQEVYASWLFIKYLTTGAAFQAEFSMASGYVPVIKSVDQVKAYKTFLDGADGGNNIAALSAKVCLSQEKAYYTSPAFIGSSTARDQVGQLLVKCLALTGADLDQQIKDAFKAAVEECEYQS